jgi:protein TonB
VSEKELFAAAHAAHRGGRLLLAGLSSLAHAAAALALVVASAYWPEALPPVLGEGARVFFYDPPPPPPPPLRKGSGLTSASHRSRPGPERATPLPVETPGFRAPREVEPLRTPATSFETEPAGSLTGSERGVPEGMEEGVEGGVVGGVPGGVVGGVIGGTGRGGVAPVSDYDRGPRALRIVKPTYPHDAFVTKIEGTVVVEVLIDESGRVAEVRVIRSVRLLDEAALDAVRQWRFVPAFRRGRPVASLVHAPVTFRIY